MKRSRIGIERQGIVAACVLGSALALAAAEPPPPVRGKLSADAWTTVPIPAVSVAANGPVLWAGGLHGSLFRSDDGGRTWREVYQGGKQDFVLDVEFPTPLTGIAIGSPGLELVSNDGGESWRKVAGPPQVAETAAFADPARGIAVARQIYRAPRWHVVKLGPREPATPVVAAAWLDTVPVCLLFAPDAKAGTQAILCSTDQGETWQLNTIGDLVFTGMVARSGSFWAAGIRLGAHPAPVTARSADGALWQVQREARTPVDDCTLQGCLEVGANAWTDPWATARAEASFPKSDTAVRRWAATRGAICVVGLALRCALTKERAIPAAAPSEWPPSLTRTQSALCLRCPPPAYPIQERQAHIAGTVYLLVEIDAFGVPIRAEILASPDRGLAAAAIRGIASWRFRPRVVGGTPQPLVDAVEVSFALSG